MTGSDTTTGPRDNGTTDNGTILKAETLVRSEKACETGGESPLRARAKTNAVLGVSSGERGA